MAPARFFSSLPTSCIAGSRTLGHCRARQPWFFSSLPTSCIAGTSGTTAPWVTGHVLLVPTDELHCGVPYREQEDFLLRVLLVPTDELHCGEMVRRMVIQI